MTSPEERKREISDFVAEAIKDNAKIFLDGAPQFNDFELTDQLAVLQIYEIKACGGELAALVEDKNAAVEEVARLYHAQKCAFEDVLTRDGFEIVSEVPSDYVGRIAFLTHHGTFTLLGKHRPGGRIITMSRIHSPHLNYDHRRGYLRDDLRLGAGARVMTGDGNSYRSSAVRAIAINPHGADDDKLEAEATVFGIGEKTAMILMQPRKVSEPVYQ